jgi:hypothetical protein
MFRWVGSFATALAIALGTAHAGAPFTDQATWAGTSAGTANAQTLSVPNFSSRITGVPLRAIAGSTNTSSATLNVSSTGAAAIKKPSPGGPTALTGGELVSGQPFTVMWDGSEWVLMSPPPAPQLVSGYRNLRVSVPSDTTFTIAANAVTVEDTNGYGYRLSNVSVTCNLTSSGANGLDIGSASASNWYGGYIIYNPTTSTVACLASLHPTSLTDTTSPTMPSGYTARQLATEVRYDSQPKLWRIQQYGNRASILFGTNPAGTGATVMASGTATQWTSVAVSNYAPPFASGINVIAVANGSGVPQVQVAPSNNYGSCASTVQPPPLCFTNAAAGNFAATATLLLESSNIYYSSGGSGTYLVTNGWTLNL